MRKLLTIAALIAVLILLPLKVSFGYEAFAVARCGSYMQSGQRADFGILAGSNSVLVTQKEANVRAMAFTGVFHVKQSDEIQGLATFFILEKRFPLKKIEIYAQFGTGSLWQIKEGDDVLNADLLIEGGIRVKEWFNVGLGLNYLPQPGPDPLFLYMSLNLIPSL